LNSDSEDDDEDEDDDHDEDEKTTKKSRPSEQIPEKSQRLQTAEQHRLTGNTAFKSNNYQQSIDYYTKSIILDQTNPVVYMNRAIAYFKLNNYDASITDCSEVLSKDPYHIKALFRRASCFLAKREYDEAKRDLDILLTVDQENNDAKNLLKTIPTVQKTKGVRIPITEDDGDDEVVHTQPTTSAPVKIPILEVEEEEEEQEQQQLIDQSPQSMNIDIPQKSSIHARP
jgi:tetratricopeptide (TPR) repeat protein